MNIELDFWDKEKNESVNSCECELKFDCGTLEDLTNAIRYTQSSFVAELLKKEKTPENLELVDKKLTDNSFPYEVRITKLNINNK